MQAHAEFRRVMREKGVRVLTVRRRDSSVTVPSGALRAVSPCLPYSSSVPCSLCSQVREILAFGTADHVGARVELEEFAMQVGLPGLIDAGFARWQLIMC